MLHKTTLPNPEKQPNDFGDEPKSEKQIIKDAMNKIACMSDEDFGKFIRSQTNYWDFIEGNLNEIEIEEINKI